MIWDNQDFQRYWRGMWMERQSKHNREAQGRLDKLLADAAKHGYVWGGGLAAAASGYAAVILTGRANEAIETFDESIMALKLEPDDADYRNLLVAIEQSIESTWPAVQTHITASLTRHAMNPSLADVTQLKDQKLAEIRRLIDRRQLEVRARNQKAIPELRDAVFNQISRLNTSAKARLGFSIFRLSETRIVSDLGRVPVGSADLATCFQALAILIDQIDQETLICEITKAGREVPNGGLNRVGIVLELHGVSHHIEVIQRLRDLRRLRESYPAHPDSPRCSRLRRGWGSIRER